MKLAVLSFLRISAKDFNCMKTALYLQRRTIHNQISEKKETNHGNLAQGQSKIQQHLQKFLF